ncbi:MAG: acyl-CoA dehydrogenase family protein [Chloroflexota bacterium]
MDFALSEEQKSIYKTVKEFAARETAPSAEERDRKGDFFWEGWRKMGKMGLLGMPYPEEYGGGGAGALTTALAMEAFTAGGGDSGTALSWGAHTILCGVPIWKLGTEEQKRKYLPALASGETVGGFGLTEPEAGSDAASIKTSAVRRGDEWVLNGTKMFITNGPIGDFFIVLAVSDKALGAKGGVSAFIVEKGFPGFSVGKELDKMGNRTSPTSELIFDDCRVPAENLLGPEGWGFGAVGLATLEWERAVMLAPCIGSMEYQLECCIRHAKERVQFGKPIAQFQLVQDKLAQIKMYLEASRLLIYRTCWLKDQEQPAMVDAAIVKMFVGEAVNKVSEMAVQVFGGYGYIREYPVERAYRDARLATLGAGTTEVQKVIVSRALLKE